MLHGAAEALAPAATRREIAASGNDCPGRRLIAFSGQPALAHRPGSLPKLFWYFKASPLHAFIIEDDYLIGQALQDMLGELGFSRFSFARSEDAAILGAAESDFDLITADVRLLPGDGVSAVEVICKDKRTPVIFITGHADAVRERLAVRFPKARIIAKPVRQEALAAAVKAVLADRV